VLSLGSDAGDDFGKSAQKDKESMSWFLGDEFGKDLGDKVGKCFSPGFYGLLG